MKELAELPPEDARSIEVMIAKAKLRLADDALQNAPRPDRRGGPSLEGRQSLGDGAYRRIANPAP